MTGRSCAGEVEVGACDLAGMKSKGEFKAAVGVVVVTGCASLGDVHGGEGGVESLVQKTRPAP